MDNSVCRVAPGFVRSDKKFQLSAAGASVSGQQSSCCNISIDLLLNGHKEKIGSYKMHNYNVLVHSVSVDVGQGFRQDRTGFRN